MKTLLHLFIGLLIITSTFSCGSSRVNYIVSCNYDKKTDITTYMKLPLGSVNLPGRWVETAYNSSSKQQYFVNKDSVLISIAFGPTNKVEFNTDNALKGFEFTKAFYEWDSQYLVEKYDLQVDILEQDSTNNYILWTIYGDTHDSKIKSYFLFGENNGIAKNFSVQNSREWNEAEICSFLKNLYLPTN